jgi:hypothetical protein
MNTKNEDIWDVLAIKEVGTVSKIPVLCHKSEQKNSLNKFNKRS